MNREIRTILLAEDSSADAEMAIDALREAKLANPVVHVEDGRQPACQFVHGPECVLCATLAVLAPAPRQPSEAIVTRAARLARPEHGAYAEAPLLLAARPRAPPSV